MRSTLLKIFSILMLVGLLHGEPIDQSGGTDGYKVHLTTEKSLVVGNNDFSVMLMQDGKMVSDAKVKIKFYMPEMPGMPYMEYNSKGKLVDGKYKLNGNFSMGGTWQYQLKFKTSDGKVHKIRGSVNI